MRIQSTELFGSLTSSAAGSLQMSLQGIENWPAGVYNFAGNGASAAQDPTAANFVVNTGALTLPTLAAGDPVLDELVLELCGRREPRVLFLPTASGDPSEQIGAFHATYGSRAALEVRAVWGAGRRLA